MRVEALNDKNKRVKEFPPLHLHERSTFSFRLVSRQNARTHTYRYTDTQIHTSSENSGGWKRSMFDPLPEAQQTNSSNELVNLAFSREESNEWNDIYSRYTLLDRVTRIYPFVSCSIEGGTRRRKLTRCIVSKVKTRNSFQLSCFQLN